jgi:hypothetical protein
MRPRSAGVIGLDGPHAAMAIASIAAPARSMLCECGLVLPISLDPMKRPKMEFTVCRLFKVRGGR